MAKEAKNKKYLVLDDVRVSYRGKDDSIHLLSTDVDFPHGFHLPIQKGTFVEEQLRSLLQERGHIKVESKRDDVLPDFAAWSDSYATDPLVSPYFFPIGLGASGIKLRSPYTRDNVQLIGFDLQGQQANTSKKFGQELDPMFAMSPHVLLCGSTGSGKSVVQDLILRTAVLRSSHWDVMGFDLKGIEFTPYQDSVEIASTMDQAVALLGKAVAIKNERYAELSRLGLNHFLDLPSPPKALLLMFDELSLLTDPTGVKTAEGREHDAKTARLRDSLIDVARYGRAAGVHLVAATQRPSAAMLGEFKANVGARILCGRADDTVQHMVLGTSGPEVTNTATPRGRFYIRIDESGQRGQALYRLRY